MNAAEGIRGRHKARRPHAVRRASFALLLALIPLALAACTPGPALIRHAVVLAPADLVSRYKYDDYFYDSGFCPFISEHQLIAGPGQVLVGANNYFDGGSGPFPCINKDDYAYRAGVRFDLKQFLLLKQIVIEKARIDWTIDRTLQTDASGNPRGVATGPNAANCVGALQEGTKSPYSQGEFLPSLPYLGGQGDVTALVTSWIVNGEPNYGFVLVGRDESFPRNKSACVNWISHITLTLVYLSTS